MNTIPKNPYVGPRTFQAEDRHLFFGREREVRDLIALAASERLILFYAQSGAGKSSILNTHLIPDLENNNFEILPVGRVQGDLPPDIEVDNIFIYNLLTSLIQQKIERSLLVKTSLSEFLRCLEFNENGYYFGKDSLSVLKEYPWRRVLIIDQFEEIFRTHLDAWRKREEFFRQLAQAMEDNRHLSVILIIREDYIASLDPYAHLLPGGLRIRYYMQRLSREAALKAVKNPVEKIRPYADGVAEKLVEDLASLQVQKPNGMREVQIGQYVEPVQLQVVCQGLWENLSPDGMEITENDLLEIGDVDQSLERFYDRRVEIVAKDRNVSERRIREWFDKALITRSGTRNMVLQGQANEFGLEHEVIQSLQGDLIRAELRAGQLWYELSHDRLIEPVRRSNTKWFEKHLSLFQRRVVVWAQQGRSESLLLRGQELLQAEQEAARLTLTADEQDFLEECRILRKQIQRDQNQRRIIFAALIVSILLLITSVFFGLSAKSAQVRAEEQKAIAEKSQAEAVNQKTVAEQARGEAEEAQAMAIEQADKALAGSLTAQANSLKGSDHRLALLLGGEAHQRVQNLLTRTTLFELLQFTPYQRKYGFDGPVTSAAVSPDGKRIAIASCRANQAGKCLLGEIKLLNEKLQELPEVPRDYDYGIVYSLAFHESSGKLILAAGGCVPKGCSEGQGQITFWEVTADNIVEYKPIRDHTALVKSLAFSPDGSLLASGSYDTTIRLWDLINLASPQKVGRPLDHDSFVNSLSFSPDGKLLASAGDDQTINLWDLADLEDIPQPFIFKQHQGPVESVAFAPKGLQPSCTGGNVLATAGDDNLVYLWDWCPDSNSLTNHFESPLKGHNGYVKSVAFNTDGTVLASAGFDNKIILWDTSTGEKIGPPLSLHTNAINELAFGSISGDPAKRPYLISVSNDRTIIQWDLSTRTPLSQSLNLADPGGWTPVSDSAVYKVTDQDLRFRVDGQAVILFDSSGAEYLKLEDFDSLISKLYFDGKHLITQDENGSFIQWTIDPRDWLKDACAAAHRNLTPEEWNQYLPNQPYKKTCAEYP
ncbi:MAG TPA: hypothetical protein VK249_31350 [Anaerolineales bacterium]|nr:hypothetical protein [Anaerolineales bacterium]